MDQVPDKRVWDRNGVLRAMLEPIRLPRMAPVRQVFEDVRVSDLEGAVAGAFATPGAGSAIRPGASVAIAVGSRGIANLPAIVAAAVANVKARGGVPFVFPAMGSHGGATAEGQRQVLEALGCTEARVGAPIRATMETRVVGTTAKGQPVHLDRFAAEADGILIIGRIKPHTAFRGPYESGIMKMMAIGMAKQKGAETVHAGGFGRMGENVPAFGRVVLANAPILFGLALLENAYDATAKVVALPAAEIEAREPALLEEARRLMPSIQIPEFDILVVDRIGKDMSGDGADPNITGTFGTPYATGGPRVERYVILGITEETHGNSLGVGMADFTTRRLFDATDFDLSYPNALTSRLVSTVRMPMVLGSDRLALQAAVYATVDGDPAAPRIVRLADTLHVERISVSEALLPALAGDPRFQVLGAPAPLPFDPDGNLF
jgi:hypothetical protein